MTTGRYYQLSPEHSVRRKPFLDEPANRRSIRTDPRSAHKPKKVLIADDDLEIVDGMARRLKFAGYDTLVASDGQQAITSALKRRPDAIILDVRMPRMDGLEALNRLKADAQTRNIPVMMVSASIQDRIAALDCGARFFLSKPYQAKALLEALDSITIDN